MFLPIVLATVCLASSQVLAAYDKPYYEVEDAETLFKEFVKEHKKVYNRREYFERLEIFKETLKDINERNDMFPDTVFAVNHFADLKPHELQAYRGLKPLNGSLPKGKVPDGLEAPEAFDWRQHSAVTPVKDQGQCGSCYIFSAVGNIEGQYAIKHNQCLMAFSEGQCLDCLKCGSCGGGFMEKVMQELAQKKEKLETEEAYPYQPSKGACHEDQSQGIALVVDGQKIEYDEETLKTTLANYGPLSIAIDAADFNYYNGGILVPQLCHEHLDHAVLLVGYGEEGGQKYWIIKNSWGTIWGEQGYVRLLRGVRACGIGLYVAYSHVAQ